MTLKGFMRHVCYYFLYRNFKIYSPFYNSYKLLDRVKLPLAKGKSSTTKLPTGRELMVALKDVIDSKKKDEPRKYVVTASIQKPDGNSFLPLLEVNAKPGEPFFVAGQTYKGGTLVIGIKVNP